MDPTTVDTAMTSAAQAMRTLTFVGAVLSLLVGLFPMMFGQVKVKWVITALASCVMFGLMGAMIGAFVPDPVTQGPTTRPATPVAPAAPAAPPPEIDWGSTALLLGSIVAAILGILLARRMTSTLRTRRAQKAQRAREIAQATDPALVARELVPELAAPVDEALSRIRLLRSLKDQIGTAEDTDALVIAERRIPSIMEMYVRASAASTDEERRDLARTALGSVVEIGRMAEDARRRVASSLRSELDTESRYISSRTGGDDALRID